MPGIRAGALFVCLVAGTSQARAQAGATPIVLVEDTIATPADSLVVTLRKQGAYRVTVTPSIGRLTLRHLRLPGTVIVLPVNDSLGRLEYYAVQLPDNGAYAVQVTGRAAPVIVRIFSDVAEETRMTRQRIDNRKRTWAIGVLASIGGHSSYETPVDPPGLSEAGSDWEVGLAASNIGRFGGSLTYGQEQRGSARKVSWISAEARGRLGRWRGVGGRTLDGGLLLRAGIGEVSRTSNDLKLIAPGAYLTHAVVEDAAGRGLQLDLAYQLGLLADGGVDGGSKTMHRALVGVRWMP